LKHAQTCLYYKKVAWLPLSDTVKSFQELHSHTMYMHVFLYAFHILQGSLFVSANIIIVLHYLKFLFIK